MERKLALENVWDRPAADRFLRGLNQNMKNCGSPRRPCVGAAKCAFERLQEYEKDRRRWARLAKRRAE